MVAGTKIRKPPARRTPIAKRYPIFKWFRAIGAGAQLFGWGSLMLAGYFWAGIALIFLGFISIAIDLWLEPGLRGRNRVRIIGSVVLFALLIGFSFGFVFVRAPLPVLAILTDGEYPDGAVIAGIHWRPEFTELEVAIYNPTDRPYENLNIVIRPDDPVTAISQETNWPDVVFEDRDLMGAHLTEINNTTRASTVLPSVLVATDAGYRVRCSRLPNKATLKLVMALCDPDTHRIKDGIGELLKMRMSDFSSYWFGPRDTTSFYTRPKPSGGATINIDGEYTVMYHVRKISNRRIPIEGIGIVPRK
jgi:hypothetical protein